MKRPNVICHMMSSVDGRIVVENWTSPHTVNKIDIVRTYGIINNEIKAEAIIEGRKTVQEDFVRTTFDYTRYPSAQTDQTHLAPHTSERYFVVVDPRGKILYEENNIRGNDIICVLGEQVSEEYLSLLREKEISYLFAGSDGRDMEKALTTLKEIFGIETVLLQGGGTINGAFLKAGLIDELSLMIYPGIDGMAGTPAVFDYSKEEDRDAFKGLTLELVSCTALENDIIWGRYKMR